MSDEDNGDHHDQYDEPDGDDQRDDGQHEGTHDDHDHHSHDVDSVEIGLVTVSSSRSLDDDPSGEYLASAFEEAGHEITVRELVPDEYDSVQGTVDRLARRKDTDAVVTTGGTGVTPDDVTPEAVKGLFAKTLPGFGELFRRLSYEEVGTRTVGTRAIAGVVSATPIFCLPGSENAVRLGVDEVILPEIGHLVGLAGRGVDEEEEKMGDVADADGAETGDDGESEAGAEDESSENDAE